ncbi:MAG: tRNA threonylcarbamoyladenosine dehydratase [Bacteroidales bacterium]|nr:tRNA threonylcarbamoyladenosine dehydratase [Bacteroidales bacterium]
MDWLERTALLLGDEAMDAIARRHVLVVGLGGVGAYAAEQLCRAGVGELTLVDGDTIQPSNINRQLLALRSTVGRPKAEVLAERFRDINPSLRLHVVTSYLHGEAIQELLAHRFDYVVDAIDTLAPKLTLIRHAVGGGHRLVSSMGSGGRLNPELVRVGDIDSSHGCPLARMLRKRLHRLGIRTGFKVVYSPEEMPPRAMRPCDEPNKKTVVGTISYMPPLFGCMLASVVLRDLIALE